MHSNPHQVTLDKSQETTIIEIDYTIYQSLKFNDIDGENEVVIGLCLLQNFEPDQGALQWQNG